MMRGHSPYPNQVKESDVRIHVDPKLTTIEQQARVNRELDRRAQAKLEMSDERMGWFIIVSAWAFWVTLISRAILFFFGI